MQAGERDRGTQERGDRAARPEGRTERESVREKRPEDLHHYICSHTAEGPNRKKGRSIKRNTSSSQPTRRVLSLIYM